MHKHNLGIEKDCSWGSVDSQPHWVDISNENKESIVSDIWLIESFCINFDRKVSGKNPVKYFFLLILKWLKGRN